MTKIDVAKLSENIQLCFDLSGDLRLTHAQMTNYLIQGKKQRGHLLNLISAKFNEGDPDLLQSNKLLSDVNAKLKNKKEAIEKASEVIKNLVEISKALDGLLKVATSFV